MSYIDNKRSFGATLLGLSLLLASGCGSYGEISPDAYQYAKALYSITNRQALDSLDPLSEKIASSLDAGKLSQSEAGWLTEMIDDGRNGDWQAANQAARQMMEDQIL